MFNLNKTPDTPADIDPTPADTITPNDQNETAGEEVNSADTPSEEEESAGTPTDTTPVVQSLAVTRQGTHSTITAKVPGGPLGWVEKRITVAYEVTAAEISKLIADVENW